MNGYRFRAQRPNDEENPYLPIMQKGGFLGMRRFNEPGLKGRTRGRQSSIDLNDKGLSMHGNAKIKYYGNPVRRSSQGNMSYQPLETTSKPVDTPISERGYSTDSDESFWKSEEGQKLMQSWNIPVIQQPAQNPVTSTQQNQTTNPYLQKPYIISDITNFGNSIKDSNGNITLGSRRYNPYSQVIKPVSARETSPVISGNGQTPVNYDIVANNGDSFTIDDLARPISFINPTLQSSGPVLTSSSAFNPYLQPTGYAPMGNLNDYMAQRSGMNITPFVKTQQNLPPILTKNRPITDNRPVVSTIPQSKCGGEKAQAGEEINPYIPSYIEAIRDVYNARNQAKLYNKARRLGEKYNKKLNKLEQLSPMYQQGYRLRWMPKENIEEFNPYLQPNPEPIAPLIENHSNYYEI